MGAYGAGAGQSNIPGCGSGTDAGNARRSSSVITSDSKLVRAPFGPIAEDCDQRDQVEA